uniref:Ion-translocating oxidoreductase complex subunit G n=1 Tax=Candidatus Kentrum sp. UNK TaxID=2126344 RepID=A0A451AU74_9GAMM|nr:MAG: electron transport complex protein RnfG [Candidatus Kentron sp. UNK]VFK69583.1 MAG: electron transport complex protein RnfG [Candidatus Kentron sp. UNK]
MNQNAQPGSLRLILTLTLAGLFSGLAIVGIYDATLPRITANKAMALQTAVFKVLPGVKALREVGYGDGRLFIPETRAPEIESVYAGFDGQDRLVGYAIPAEGPGFQDTIRLLYGYRPDRGRITGMEILESRETPGLGDKIYKDLDFVASFQGLRADSPIRAVKKGAVSDSNAIDAITGATISSVAVVRIINQANARWLSRLADADGDFHPSPRQSSLR